MLERASHATPQNSFKYASWHLSRPGLAHLWRQQDIDLQVPAGSIRRFSTSNRREHSSRLTHVNETGQAHMVSVAGKSATRRVAVARGYVQTTKDAIQLIQSNSAKKGDVLATARIAGIMGSKQTSTLIPLCHNIILSKVAVDLTLDEVFSRVNIEATAECVGLTGVEMEALTACSTAALTVYDMLKAVDKSMVISHIRVVKKIGGKSGDWTMEE